jgi:hypothetical protein
MLHLRIVVERFAPCFAGKVRRSYGRRDRQRCGEAVLRGLTLGEENDTTGQSYMTLRHRGVTAQVKDCANSLSVPPTIQPSLRDRNAKAKRTAVSSYRLV